ncbi:hypothetical protein FSP39_009596 [Pinctada imbricata]|uniref:Uncharacterized protein n=1 Tax=Pinctada imbricata TaxID=66713 RepID=A0AA88XLS8_PINIB|nr:hypothetical protein FSP39_009596 [Pinctada imbricata]
MWKKELDDPKDSDKSSSSDSKRVHGSDDNYSDDFENSNSSDSTVKEIKGNKEEVTERKVKPGPRGEYYDEAYACDDENVPMHDGNEEMHVGNEEMHDKKAVSHKALNGQKSAAHITADIISIKSLEEDKKYYLSDDETDRDEIEKGPLATTFEDMNIIGPLATLLVKVRRIKRLNAAKGSHSDLNSDNLDGVSRNSVGSMLEEESLEYAGNIVTESSSLSSLNWDELPNGKKKLDPIKKKKKSKAKVNQNDHSFDSEEEYVERPLQRRLSNASILSREYIQATQEVVMSVLESQRQMAKSCKQVADSSKIVMASSKEVLESSKQVNESSKQVNESSKQVNNSSQQVIASSKHVIESAMHAVEVLKKTADEYKSSNGQSDPAVERQSEKEATKDGDTKPEEKESLQNQEEEKKSESKTEDPVEVVDEARKETTTVTSVPTEDDDFKEDSSVSHASSRATDERSHNTDESTECADFIPEEDIPHDFEDTVFDKVVRLFDSVPQPDEPHSHEEKQDTEKTESQEIKADDSPQIVKGKTYFDLLREKKLERKPILKRRMTVPDNFKPQSTEEEEGEETITMTVPKTFLYMEYGHKSHLKRIHILKLSKLGLQSNHQENLHAMRKLKTTWRKHKRH